MSNQSYRNDSVNSWYYPTLKGNNAENVDYSVIFGISEDIILDNQRLDAAKTFVDRALKECGDDEDMSAPMLAMYAARESGDDSRLLLRNVEELKNNENTDFIIEVQVRTIRIDSILEDAVEELAESMTKVRNSEKLKELQVERKKIIQQQESLQEKLDRLELLEKNLQQ